MKTTQTTTEERTMTTIGISDGMSWNAGGIMTTSAESPDEIRDAGNKWADAGDYPCDAPVSVTLIARDDSDKEIDRWQHRVPDEACSGDPRL